MITTIAFRQSKPRRHIHRAGIAIASVAVLLLTGISHSEDKRDDRIIETFFLKYMDVEDALEALKTNDYGNATFHPFRSRNIFVARANPKAIEEIGSLITSLDVPREQCYVEPMLVQFSVEDSDAVFGLINEHVKGVSEAEGISSRVISKAAEEQVIESLKTLSNISIPRFPKFILAEGEEHLIRYPSQYAGHSPYR